ncbi:MAG: hypothetical protein CL917_07295 [Deltaproteobacteria bacterium]|nr:hypothetical protein [Deltaproteobacteria bacterium]
MVLGRTLLRFFLLPLAAVIVAALIGITLIAEGVGGRLQGRETVSPQPRPSTEIQTHSLSAVQKPEIAKTESQSQILFGDLHVHTTFSADAFAFSLPIFQGEGAHPPADACDFARFCSALDFWSINDHAESITPRQWEETLESIRECNEVSDPLNPDTVAFLGWEWTQSAPPNASGEKIHYGHKNIILRDTEQDQVPTRPIGAGAGGLFQQPLPSAVWALARFGISARDLDQLQPYLDFNRFLREARSLKPCPEGVPVRDLPKDCLEGAETPEILFQKLDDWGFPSLVIPHGTSWGIHAPPDATLDQQLSRADHDPKRQRLFEVYSGHGNSEVYRKLIDINFDEEGERICAPPQNGYVPCCWQAGELIRERCEQNLTESECEERAKRTRQLAVETGNAYSVVSGTTPADWLECGQLPKGFLPAFDYRPNMSAQYGLSIVSEDGSTYRYGLIASSDNHSARAGSGYKEIPRSPMSDAYGLRDDWLDMLLTEGAKDPLPLETPQTIPGVATAFERGASFYYTGGLIAVHAGGRDRQSIWDALESRNVYGTSGDRILLHFNLLNSPEGSLPMGSEAETSEPPHFEVRALGAFEQHPGCPESVRDRLTPERLQKLCLGECYHPSDRRKKIERIEVVRIRKQLNANESIEDLIEDPWRTFQCVPNEAGCRVNFTDPEPDTERENVYYVRAIQEAEPTVNGSPVRCERDEHGACVRARNCAVSGPRFDPTDPCLANAQERAWSSPLFIRFND